jgi:hypothetical protein
MRPLTTASGVERGAEQEGNGRQAEAEGDRHAQQHAGAEQQREEDEQVPVADALQPAGAEVQRRPVPPIDRATPTRSAKVQAGQPQQADRDHAGAAHRHRGRANGVRPAERGRLHDPLVTRVFHHRPDQDGRAAGRARRRPALRPRPVPAGSSATPAPWFACACRAQRDGRAQVGEPEEQDRRQFVGPGHRAVEDEAHDHAGQQHEHLADHQRRGGSLDGEAQPALGACREADLHVDLADLQQDALAHACLLGWIRGWWATSRSMGGRCSSRAKMKTSEEWSR